MIHEIKLNNYWSFLMSDCNNFFSNVSSPPVARQEFRLLLTTKIASEVKYIFRLLTESQGFIFPEIFDAEMTQSLH